MAFSIVFFHGLKSESEFCLFLLEGEHCPRSQGAKSDLFFIEIGSKGSN